ncbi:hypothetical protein [Cylindrospermopsis raciborskii]|nr:hypothetical protein [Cylindrospermopsis raciborskii]MCZ2207343.1 hypothetical protein [Cylindrospermopsis raciborskii PAMP2011]
MHDSITAYLSVKDGKHVWSQWNQLNKTLTSAIAPRRKKIQLHQ